MSDNEVPTGVAAVKIDCTTIHISLNIPVKHHLTYQWVTSVVI